MRLILPERRIILPPRGWRPELLKPFVRRPFKTPFRRAPLQAAIGRSTLFSEAVNSGDPWTLAATPTLTTGHFFTLAITDQCFGGNTLPTGFTFNRGTWTIVHATLGKIDDTTNLHSLWMFRGIGDGSTGAFTISQTGGTGLKMANVTCEDWTGVDTGGTNGSNAIVQVNSGLSASANPQIITITLAALGDALNNAVYMVPSGGSSSTPGGSYTSIVNQAGTDYWISSQWLLPGDTSPSATAATAFQPQLGIAIELKAAGGGGGGATGLEESGYYPTEPQTNPIAVSTW